MIESLCQVSYCSISYSKCARLSKTNMQKSIWYHHEDATNLCFAFTSVVGDKFTVSWATDALNTKLYLIHDISVEHLQTRLREFHIIMDRN